jgi:signal transduction histidine kinase
MIRYLWERAKQVSVSWTKPNKRSKFERYLFPVVIISIITLAKVILHVFVSEYTFHLLPIVIILSALFGGLGPGLLATVLVAILDTFVFTLPGISTFDLDNIVSTALLIFGGVIVSFISEARSQTDQQKDEFIGFASHELKNPLAAIQGYAQLLQRNVDKISKQKIATYAGTIEAQTMRATNLINELLDITKIERGTLSYHNEKFSLYDLVEDIVRDQRIIFPTRKIVLTGSSTRKVFGDTYRIGQVLINLITNAIKYSPETKNVKVTIENKPKSVLVSVSDNGTGISKENKIKIFDPYFREQSVSRGKVPGLGLGLYISNEIVRRHQGKIWVKSTVGKGSTFFVLLPTITR